LRARDCLREEQAASEARLAKEVRRAFGRLHKRRKEIAVEERGREDKHEWSL
jgi:hypothetical protein